MIAKTASGINLSMCPKSVKFKNKDNCGVASGKNRRVLKKQRERIVVSRWIFKNSAIKPFIGLKNGD
jgi:hypothetical protein